MTHDAGYTLLLINRAPNNVFYALNPKCTHNGCTVHIYSTTYNGILCPCHGSFYDIDGSVINGPASRDLAKYEASFDLNKNMLSIALPDLNFTITNIKVFSKTGDTLRLELTFPTIAAAQYDIEYTADLSNAGQRVLFSKTPTGPATNSTLTGTGSNAVVYVDSNAVRGFYQVGVILTQRA